MIGYLPLANHLYSIACRYKKALKLRGDYPVSRDLFGTDVFLTSLTSPEPRSEGTVFETISPSLANRIVLIGQPNPPSRWLSEDNHIAKGPLVHSNAHVSHA